jgi:hypothetical protein
LFADSVSSGKLLNVVATDYGAKVQKAKVSIGNVPVGIHKRGPKKGPREIFHNKETEQEIFAAIQQLKNKSNYYASARNLLDKGLSNFTDEEVNNGLLLTTLTCNFSQTEMTYRSAP